MCGNTFESNRSLQTSSRVPHSVQLLDRSEEVRKIFLHFGRVRIYLYCRERTSLKYQFSDLPVSVVTNRKCGCEFRASDLVKCSTNK